MPTLEDLFDHSPWIESLTDKQLKQVRQGIVEKTFDTGQCICRKGTPAASWVGVIDGLVRVGTESKTGKRFSMVTGVPAGSWFGEGSLMKREKLLYDVMALRPSHIAFLPEKLFFQLLDESIGLNRFLLNHLNERLGQFISLLEYDRLLSPEERVARSLSTMFNYSLYPGTELHLQLSQEELGCLAGVSRQRVNQALKVLQDKHILAVKYGEIEVLDLAALKGFESD